MAYSTIIKRRCKCSDDCKKYPTMGYGGYFSLHAPEEIKERVGTKRQVQVRNRNKRIALSAKLHKVQNEVVGSDKWKSDLWFAARHHEMTGRCLLCYGTTCKGTEIFKHSIAHLFQKAYFETIKWHEENWIELCFYNQSHHTNFDNKMLTFGMIKEQYPLAWKEIVRKTKILYPLMTNQEQGRVPQILIDEIHNS